MRLREIVFHSRDSLICRALEGAPLPALSQSLLTSVVNDLRRYLDVAVESDLIDEACYIQQCIDSVRGDRSGERLEAERELKSIEERIRDACLELAEREQYWGAQQAMIERELQMGLEDLEISHEQAATELDNDWDSAKRKQQYSKPSAALLNLRHMVKKLIRAKKFEEVRRLAPLIETRQRQEIDEATRRMNADYQKADQLLSEKYELERSVLIGTSQTKIHNLIRLRELALRPINQRIQNLEKLRDGASTGSKDCGRQGSGQAAANRGGKSTALGHYKRTEAAAPEGRENLEGEPQVAWKSAPLRHTRNVPPSNPLAVRAKLADGLQYCLSLSKKHPGQIIMSVVSKTASASAVWRCSAMTAGRKFIVFRKQFCSEQ
jgi:hypothetical protein